MPLPSDVKAPWPPPDVAPYIRDMRATSAWWSGDPTALAATSDGGGTTGRSRFWSRTRGPRARNERQFADTVNTPGNTGQLHAPLAADICATSADLLFGEPPELLLPGLQDARSPDPGA